VDRVHFTLRGAQLLGRAVAAELRARQLVGPAGPPPVEVPLADGPPRFVGPDTLTALASSAFQQGRTQEAVRRGREAVARNPDALQAHLLRGFAYDQLGQSEEVRKALGAVRALYQRDSH
jgi:tetratricopeptide (TPR) repeat protein